MVLCVQAPREQVTIHTGVPIDGYAYLVDQGKTVYEKVKFDSPQSKITFSPLQTGAVELDDYKLIAFRKGANQVEEVFRKEGLVADLLLFKG